MAQDIFFIPLREGDDTFRPLRKEIVAIVAAGNLLPLDQGYLRYDDGSGGEAFSIADAEAGGDFADFAFGRFGGRTMMERIFALAELLDVVLVWSDTNDDKPNACVVGEHKLAQIDQGLATALTVVVARDADDLNKLVKGATFEQMGL